MLLSLLLFALAFCFAFLTTPWVVRLPRRNSFGLDEANETRKRHAGEIPRLGGIPVLLALSVCLVLILTTNPSNAMDWFPVLLGMLMMCGMGLWDDFKPIGARNKFLF